MEPRRSTHGEPWIYATPHLEMVVPYLAKWGDVDFAQSHVEGDFFLVERYPGAFRSVFSTGSGSIYRVPAATFRELEPGGPEWVSDVAVDVLEETRVDEAWAHLVEIAGRTRLRLYFHPDRPDFIPSDDSDLLAKFVRWIAAAGWPRKENASYEDFCEKHAALRPRLEALLDEVGVG